MNSRIFTPSLIVIAILVPFLGYHVARVDNQRKFQDNRAYRLLETAAEQLTFELEAVRATTDAAHLYAARPNPQADDFRRYLAHYLVEATVKAPDSLNAPKAFKAEVALSLQVPDSGEPTYLTARRGPGDPLTVRYPLGPLTGRLLPADARTFFDRFYVATSTGTVLSATGPLPLTVTHLDALIQNQVAEEIGWRLTNHAPNPPKPLTTRDFTTATQRRRVILAGQEFVLFLIPTALHWPQDGAGTSSVSICLVGLVRASQLESRAMALPGISPLAVFLAIVILVTLAWPPLKLYTMSPQERLHPQSLVAMALSCLFALLLLSLVYLSFGLNQTLTHTTDLRLRLLAERLRANFHEETRKALVTLTVEAPKIPPGMHTFQSLKIAPTDRFSGHPFFEHLFLAQRDEKEGTKFLRQTAKLTANSVATPLIPLKPSVYPAVRDFLAGNFLRSPVHPPFTIQTVQSPNTGEYLTLLATPVAPANPTGCAGCAAMMSLRLASLTDPIIQPGFAFAVVDPAGRVLFHSSMTRAGRENFFRECGTPAAAQSLAGAGRPEGFADLNYGGRQIRAHFSQLNTPHLAQQPPIVGLNWTLITFREVDHNKETVFQAAVIYLSVILAVKALIFGALVIWGVRRIFKPVAHAFRADRRLWPRRREKGRYLIEAAITGMGSIVLVVISGWHHDNEWPLYLPPILLGVFVFFGGAWALAYYFPGDRFWKFWDGLLEGPASTWPLNSIYSVRWACVTLFLIGGGSLVAYQATLHALQYSYEARTHFEIMQRLDDRRDHARQQYRQMSLPASGEEQYLKVRVTGFAQDIADARVHPQSWPHQSAALRSFYLSPLLRIAQPIVALSGRTWAPIFFSADGGLPEKLDQEWASHFTEPGTVVSRAPGLIAWPALPNLDWALSYSFIGLLLTGAFFAWVHSIVRRLFVQDFEDLAWAGELSADNFLSLVKERRRLLVFAHPESGTSEFLGLQLKVPPAFVLINFSRLRLLPAAAWGGIRQSILSYSSDLPLVFENLETVLDQPGVRGEALDLLLSLTAATPRRICIFSSVDPTLWLTDPPAGQAIAPEEASRWIRLFGGYDRTFFDPPHDIAATRLAMNEQVGVARIASYVTIFNRELDRVFHLRTMAALLMRDFDPHSATTAAKFERFLVRRSLQVADGFYHALWQTCTPSERQVLHQLAADGWANPLNRVALAQLVRRRLIVVTCPGGVYEQRGAYEIINESFRRFVLGAVTQQELETWAEGQKHSLWRGLRIALIVVVALAAVWFSYVRRDVFDLYIGYLLAATGGSAALLRWLFELLRGRGADRKA